MADEGLITQEEYINTNFPQFYRTPEQFLEPFKDEHSKVRQLGLQVEKWQTATVPCPYRELYNKGTLNASQFSASYVKTLRSWSEGVFMAGLGKRRCGPKQELIDTFYERYRSLVESSPQDHGMDYVHCYLLVAKQSKNPQLKDTA